MLDTLRAKFAAVGRCTALAGLALADLGMIILLLGLVIAPAGGVAYGTGDHHAYARAAFLLSVAGAVPFILLAGPVILAGIRQIAIVTRRLVGEWTGIAIADPYRPGPANGQASLWRRVADPATWRDVLWFTLNGSIGLVLLLIPVLATGGGIFSLVRLVLLHETGFMAGSPPQTQYLVSFALTAAGLWMAPPFLRAYGVAAHAMLSPTGNAELARRVRHLAQTRTETLDTSAAEIRRIERDLHDGAQARLVAMGMTLDAAGQLIDDNPKAARALLIEARDNSAKALQELRALVRGIHPPVLADRGLTDAIRALALDTPLRIHLTSDGDSQFRPPAPVESAAYFAVSELLANVSKHAQARQAWVDIRHDEDLLKITVTDDGQGGADPSRGSGLTGLERRVAAFDGVLALSSPPGGPTVVNLEIPCELR